MPTEDLPFISNTSDFSVGVQPCYLFGSPESTKLVDGGGNCFYCAIAWIFTGEQTDHLEIRKKLATYMDLYSFEPGDPNISEPGIYATDREIAALSSALNINIWVYADQTKSWQRFAPSCAELGTLNLPPLCEDLLEIDIFLSLRGNQLKGHYEPVTELGKTSQVNLKNSQKVNYTLKIKIHFKKLAIVQLELVISHI